MDVTRKSEEDFSKHESMLHFSILSLTPPSPTALHPQQHRQSADLVAEQTAHPAIIVLSVKFGGSEPQAKRWLQHLKTAATPRASSSSRTSTTTSKVRSRIAFQSFLRSQLIFLLTLSHRRRLIRAVRTVWSDQADPDGRWSKDERNSLRGL